MLELFYFFEFIIIFFIYVLSDYYIRKKFEGTYYLIHFINNTIITYYTFPSVLYSYTNLYNYYDYNFNYHSVVLTFSLHSYHIYSYWNKLDYYDWLHHILMCVVALPLGIYIDMGCFLDHGLFYLTGIPGGLNYFMLFLTRNEYMKRITQKKYNNAINLWFRAPGCVSQVALSIVAVIYTYERYTQYQIYMMYIASFLIYWNGIFFMNMVCADYANVNLKKQLHIL